MKFPRALTLFREFLSRPLQHQELNVVYHPDKNIKSTLMVKNETRNMLIVLDGLETCLIPKSKTAIYRIKLGKHFISFPGLYLIGSPNKRKKIKLKKW